MDLKKELEYVNSWACCLEPSQRVHYQYQLEEAKKFITRIFYRLGQFRAEITDIIPMDKEKELSDILYELWQFKEEKKSSLQDSPQTGPDEKTGNGSD